MLYTSVLDLYYTVICMHCHRYFWKGLGELLLYILWVSWSPFSRGFCLFFGQWSLSHRITLGQKTEKSLMYFYCSEFWTPNILIGCPSILLLRALCPINYICIHSLLKISIPSLDAILSPFTVIMITFLLMIHQLNMVPIISKCY